jgi:hypothetical protein
MKFGETWLSWHEGVCLYNQLCFSELQWYFSLVLFVSRAFFFLVFISFSFVAFLATMALRPKLVVSVDDINEGNRDVAFEGKVLCWYRNWDPSKERNFPYLHCNLIDRAGFTTITISVRNPQIKQHEVKLHVGSFVQI